MQLEPRETQSKQYLLRSGSKALCNGWLYWYLSYYALKRRDLSNLQQGHFRYPTLRLHCKTSKEAKQN